MHRIPNKSHIFRMLAIFAFKTHLFLSATNTLMKWYFLGMRKARSSPCTFIPNTINNPKAKRYLIPINRTDYYHAGHVTSPYWCIQFHNFCWWFQNIVVARNRNRNSTIVIVDNKSEIRRRHTQNLFESRRALASCAEEMHMKTERACCVLFRSVYIYRCHTFLAQTNFLEIHFVNKMQQSALHPI